MLNFWANNCQTSVIAAPPFPALEKVKTKTLLCFLLPSMDPPRAEWLVVKSGSRLLERGRGARPLGVPPNPPLRPLCKPSSQRRGDRAILIFPVNGLLFLRGSTIVAPLTSGGAAAERKAPLTARGPSSPAFARTRGQGSPPRKKGDRDWARPPHPGFAVRGRRESCS